MIEVVFEALKQILKNEPWKVLLTLALIYLYWDLKKARGEIKDQWKMRLQDMKDLAKDQNDVKKSVKQLIKDVEQDNVKDKTEE